MPETIESPSYRSWITQRESAPKVLDVTDVPIKRKDMNTDDNGFRPVQRYIEHNPDGFDTVIASALVDEEATFSGNYEPRYSEILLDLPQICGPEGFVSADTLADGRPKYVFQLPHKPRSIQEVSAWYGYGDKVFLLQQVALRAWSIETSKGGETGGNKEYHALSFLSGQSEPNQTEQDAEFQITATNVSTDGVFEFEIEGEQPETVTFEIGDTTSDTEAKLLAVGITADVTGTVAVASGEIHTLNANGATGNATIYGDVVVAPGATSGSLQTTVRAKGGNYANVVVAGSTTAYNAAGTRITTGGTSTKPNAFDGDTGTLAVGDAATVPTSFVYDRGAGNATDADKYSIKITDDGVNNPTEFYLEGSNDNATWDQLDFQPNTVAYTNAEAGFKVAGPFTIASNTAYRYWRLRVTRGGAESGSVVLADINIVKDGTPSTGAYTFTYPQGVGNVADITNTPGTGWSTSTTQPGNAGGTITAQVSEPAATRITLSKTSGAGWNGSVTQDGSDGEGPSELFGSNIEPTHWVVYKAATKAELDAIDMGTRTVPAALDEEHIVQTSTGHGISLENLVGVTKTENRSVHAYRHVPTAPTVTATLTLLVQQNAEGEDYAESIYSTENKGGCSTTPFWLRFAARCGERELWIDIYCARNQAADPTTEEGVAMWQFQLTRIYRKQGSLFFTLIEPMP